MKRWYRIIVRSIAVSIGAALLSLSGLVLPTKARAQTLDGATLEAIRTADMRLTAIGFRLAAAAAPLCDRLEPGIGFQLHTLAQYGGDTREQVRRHFGFVGAVAVEGVVADSPAAKAGVRADDSLVAINGVATPVRLDDAASTAMLEALHGQLAALAPRAPVVLDLMRRGQALRVTVQPVAACRSRFEMKISGDFDARATGQLVQVSSKFLEDVEAELLPAMIAHELSHNILRHRERLNAVGADFGFASGFGRNVGLFRQTEIEADILAVHLLARAGYSPQLAVRFWSEVGPRLIAGRIRRRSHPPTSQRVAIAQAEAAKFARGTLPPPPAFLAERGQPIAGEWRKYLPPEN